MMRLGVLTALVALIALPREAAAEVARPVCGSPAVLERLAALLHEAGRPMVLDEAAGEISAGTSRLVHCAVRGQMLGYDTNQHGMQPINATFVVRYALELRQNGIFLHLE